LELVSACAFLQHPHRRLGLGGIDQPGLEAGPGRRDRIGDAGYRRVNERAGRRDGVDADQARGQNASGIKDADGVGRRVGGDDDSAAQPGDPGNVERRDQLAGRHDRAQVLPAGLRGEARTEFTLHMLGVQAGREDMATLLRLDDALAGLLFGPAQDAFGVRGDHRVAETALQERRLGPHVDRLILGRLQQRAEPRRAGEAGELPVQVRPPCGGAGAGGVSGAVVPGQDGFAHADLAVAASADLRLRGDVAEPASEAVPLRGDRGLVGLR